MPLTEKGKKIKSAMVEQYGPEKGKQVFFASANKGTIEGVEKKGHKPGNPHGMKAGHPLMGDDMGARPARHRNKSDM